MSEIWEGEPEFRGRGGPAQQKAETGRNSSTVKYGDKDSEDSQEAGIFRPLVDWSPPPVETIWPAII